MASVKNRVPKFPISVYVECRLLGIMTATKTDTFKVYVTGLSAVKN